MWDGVKEKQEDKKEIARPEKLESNFLLGSTHLAKKADSDTKGGVGGAEEA